jgi:hypothetical protein
MKKLLLASMPAAVSGERVFCTKSSDPSAATPKTLTIGQSLTKTQRKFSALTPKLVKYLGAS